MNRNLPLIILVPLCFLWVACSPTAETTTTDCSAYIDTTYASYSWIETFADGSIDTLFANNPYYKPGDTSIPLAYSVGITPVYQVILDPIQIPSSCTAETVVLDDTLILSRELTIRNVLIKNGAAIQQQFDTLAGIIRTDIFPIAITHFANDSATVSVTGPSWFVLDDVAYYDSTTSTCDPAIAPLIRYITSTTGPHLRITSLAGVSSGNYPWTLRVHNKFGFSDSISGSIYIPPSTCTDTTVVLQKCQRGSVIPQNKHQLFTWIQPYADGHRDTLWSADSSTYQGSEQQRLIAYQQFENIAVSQPESTFTAVDTLVCPGDSLYRANGRFYWRPAGTDTTWLNWGLTARDGLVEPTVRIAKADSLRAALDSLVYYQFLPGFELYAYHFRGDSATLTLDIATDSLLTLGDTGDNFCPTNNPCATIPFDCMMVVHIGNFTAYPMLQANPGLATPLGEYTWKLRLRNRFGYQDSVVGTSTLHNYVCH